MRGKGGGERIHFRRKKGIMGGFVKSERGERGGKASPKKKGRSLVRPDKLRKNEERRAVDTPN